MCIGDPFVCPSPWSIPTLWTLANLSREHRVTSTRMESLGPIFFVSILEFFCSGQQPIGRIKECLNQTHYMMNNSINTWNAEYRHPAAFMSVLLAVIILLTNGVIMIAYAKDRKLRTLSHFFLMNLVLADFLVGLALPMHAVSFLIPRSSLNKYICLAQFSMLGELRIKSSSKQALLSFVSYSYRNWFTL